jgi:hypothetical protein
VNKTEHNGQSTNSQAQKPFSAALSRIKIQRFFDILGVFVSVFVMKWPKFSAIFSNATHRPVWVGH